MPDSLLPIQGPASRRERDLDSLLSGEAGYPTVVLGPVAGVLGALRRAPGPDELDGEEAARAAFRLFVRPAAAGSPAELPRTIPSAGPRHRRARHGRPRRWVPRSGHLGVMAVAGSAAAAVIIAATALAGAFSGPGGHQGPAGQGSSAQAAADTSNGRATSPVLEGGGRSVPPARPAHRPDTSPPTAASPQELCRQYLGFLAHLRPSANWPPENAIQQLSSLAGGRLRINAYCAEQLGAAGPGPGPDHQGGAEAPGSGGQPGRGRFAEPGTVRRAGYAEP